MQAATVVQSPDVAPAEQKKRAAPMLESRITDLISSMKAVSAAAATASRLQTSTESALRSACPVCGLTNCKFVG